MIEKMTKYKKTSLLSFADKQAISNFLQYIKILQLKDALKVVYWWLVTEGWRWSPLSAYEKHISNKFDQSYGTDTLLRCDLDELDIESKNRDHGVYYQASPVYSTNKILRKLDIKYEEFIFIDIGSGKGRTLLLASELSFKSVIGIEFSRELHAIAQKNIQIYPKKVSTNVKSILVDATNFDIPKDNIVFYLFNPFDDSVLMQVILNITNSLKQDDRQAYLVYHYTPNVDLLTDNGFRLIKHWRRYHVFQWSRD